MTSSDDERFDGLYLNVAQTTRGIEPLLDTVFSFLRRKTDFFAGPPGVEGEAGTDKVIEKVMEVLQKHAEIYKKSKETAAASISSNKKKKASPPKKKAEAPKQNLEADVIELGSDGKFDASSAAVSEKSGTQGGGEAATLMDVDAPEKKGINAAAADNDDEKRGPPPLGNGGTVEGKYVWTQILSEVVVTIPVPQNTRGRDLNVVISKKHLKIALLRPSTSDGDENAVIIDAPLTKAVICDDSFWTVEDGCRLVVNLQKLNPMEWWDSVCEGHPKIDVRTIQPESSSLSTYRNDIEDRGFLECSVD